jgi:hypothetical protein
MPSGKRPEISIAGTCTNQCAAPAGRCDRRRDDVVRNTRTQDAASIRVAQVVGTSSTSRLATGWMLGGPLNFTCIALNVGGALPAVQARPDRQPGAGASTPAR